MLKSALTGLLILGVLLAATNAVTEARTETNEVSTPQAYAASMLGMWIARSRDRAIELGVDPIPGAIREALSGYVPDTALDRVRWRELDGLSLGFVLETVFESHPTPAMTLDFVVIFRDGQEARENPALWAHELKHVMQYEAWGIEGFALRYVSDFEAVEFEASEFRWGWLEKQRIAREAAGAPD